MCYSRVELVPLGAYKAEYLWFGLCSIADMGGTNITQIDSTYYHLNVMTYFTNAVADYRVDSAGLRKMRDDVDAAKLILT